MTEQAKTDKPNPVALFDLVAEDYDQVDVEWFRPIAGGLVAAVAPQPGERALDLGCGRGAALFPLAAAVGPTGSVTGIDLAPRMIELLGVDVAAAGLGNVALQVADAAAPPLPAGSYDVAVSSLVLFFLPDPGAALRAWRELLVPGGRLAVATFGPFSEHWKQVDAVFERYLPQEMRDARTTATKGPFATDEGVEQLLRDAGFGEVRTQTLTVTARFTDAEHWHRWSMSHGQRGMWLSVPPDQRESVREQAYAAIGGFRREDGTIGFDQVVRYTFGRR